MLRVSISGCDFEFLSSFSPYVLALRASLYLTFCPSVQLGPYVLALRASFVLMYWPFGPACSWWSGPSDQFFPDLLALRPVWSYLYGPSVLIACFLIHGIAENRWCSIFGTSKNGVTPNLISNSDFPSFIYPKTGQDELFITWKCRKPVMFYF